MVDIAELQKRKVSSGDWKALFTLEVPDYPNRLQKLVDLLSARVRDGRTMNLRDYRTYAAIDLAYDAAFNQTTATFVHHLMSKNWSADKIHEALDGYGLSERDLFMRVPTGDGGEKLMLNPPIFFRIFIPIVKAYVTIRLAKLFNERNKSPLFTYDPLKETPRNRLVCEIITDVIQKMSTDYGYAAVLRQAIQQMLKYGTCIAFPREEWNCQEQILDGAKKVVKEGLRYVLPHPTRMFSDLMYPLTSLNTDTGCEFAGYWHILKYSDILDNPDYWNRKKIFYGTNWFESPLAGNYFNEVYPCAMKFPAYEATGSSLSREDRAAYYATGDTDKAVFVTEIFVKLRPRQWGLGSYRFPIWARFVLAGDDTVIWAEPCAYNPMWFMGYDYDEQAARTPSLGLETIPWQDTLGNILSQMLLTAKQSLANVVFYDSNIVDATEIRKLENSGEQMYRGLNFMAYDSMLHARAGLNVKEAFNPIQLRVGNITEMLQMLPSVLSIMERVLQITAQELGSAASHQQSKAEIVQTGGASTNRVVFTGSFIDDAVDAWKRQLYDGSMAYQDPDVAAQVSTNIENAVQILEDIGFTVHHVGQDKMDVRGDKKRLSMDSFAASNKGPEGEKNVELAQIIFQVVGTIAQQQDLHQKVGAQNLLKLVERAAHLAGAPNDFRLEFDPKADQQGQVEPQIIQAIQQAQQATLQAVQEKVAQPAAQQAAKTEQQMAQMGQMLEQLKGIYQIAAQTQDKNAIKAKETAAAIQRKDQVAAADQRRKDAVTAKEQQRRDAELAAKLQRDKAAATTSAGLEVAKTHAQMTTDAMAAKTDIALQAAKISAGIENDTKVADAKAKAAAKSKPAK